MLTSTLGKGTKVTLRVPLVAAAPMVVDQAMAPKPSVILRAGSLSATPILVAEDNPINQLLISSMLERLGYHSHIASDGAIAVRMIEQAAAAGAPYRLIFMDIQMPEIDGVEATRQIRATGIAPTDLPIIALTANAYPDDVKNCLAAGMQGHLTKPVTLSTVDAIVRRWVGASPEHRLAPIALHTAPMISRP